MNWRRWFFEWQYWFGKPRWDTNVTPPEVVAYIESTSARGRALDLGCGTGTNSIFLAQHGFEVVAVDFSRKAIARARDKARRARVAIDFYVADVTRLDFLNTSFDFLLDVGCLHGIEPAHRTRYAEHLARLTRAGAVFMLYAFAPLPPDAPRPRLRPRSVGITEEQVRALFAAHFDVERVQHGTERGERASAWYWLRRR
ncbi:MAG: methyltransferase domain-containing protein [Anaerolineae bacterium]|nr:methyltransferase domain-containing protein [Anaerolineae bacterium]